MKKIFLFAAAAALLTACSSEELSNSEVAQQNNAEKTPVAFSIYTPRNVTRAGEAGMQTTITVGDAAKSGFGVFGYYTNNGNYVETSTPNFMYNQQVKGDGDGTAAPTKWQYEPVKYWPNEYGQSAIADEIDRVTFFAYAPWTRVVPSTGIPAAGVGEDEKGITAMTKNTGAGDPIIKYVVDTDPATSVDLLWGVYAGNEPYKTTWGTATATVQPGMPFIDLLKPNNPATTDYTEYATTTTPYSVNTDNKVRFNLRHALSKLFVTIDYFDDALTYGTTGKLEASKETKIWVREVKIGGFMMKGALNLNNTTSGANKPNWKAYDGTSDLEYEETIFKDGRKDGSEGTPDGEATNEKYAFLNPDLIQSTEYKLSTIDDTKFDNTWSDANTGVTVESKNLFRTWDTANSKWIGASTTAGKGDIFVIPMNKPIDVSIVYDVETTNKKLAEKLSDKLTPGKSIENKIFKTSAEIFGTATNMEAGKYYVLHLHIGMTSVKVEAEVMPWDDQNPGTATLPANNN